MVRVRVRARVRVRVRIRHRPARSPAEQGLGFRVRPLLWFRVRVRIVAIFGSFMGGRLMAVVPTLALALT